jgi:hypothetical protein
MTQPTLFFTNMMERLSNIKAGETICYYEGYTPCSDLPKSERVQVFQKAHNLYNIGRAVLVQERVENDGIFGSHVNKFRYFARGK